VSASNASPSANALALSTLLVECCVQLGVRDFVIAPGSRSAPLTAALARSADVRTVLVYDERSAGHVALGMAQQLRRPVGMVCTSGTAAVNFGPAIVEAFYQQVPLLALTADRPPEWIDQEDNQAIRQTRLFGEHLRAFFTLPLSDNHPDAAWHVRRTVSDAIQTATALPNGPVQINLPLREPLYSAQPLPIPLQPRPAVVVPTLPRIADSAWPELLHLWTSARRKLIISGMHPADPELAEAIQTLADIDPNVALIGDVTGNLMHTASSLGHWDTVLASRDAALLDALAPDLVLTIGGQVTSKALKGFLRRYRPAVLWRVAPGLPAPDTYQGLTHVLPVPAAPFIGELAQRLHVEDRSQLVTDSGYAQFWRCADDAARRSIHNVLADAHWTESTAINGLLDALPQGTAIQLGNSLPIRHVNLLGFREQHLPASVHSNRGASGIDGVVSTAVGAALADDTKGRLTLLIVGDLSFFYDRNGLWHPNIPPNLRIVLLNNHGGGIFDLLEGPSRLDAAVRTQYFLTPQPLNARHTAQDHGLRYAAVSEAHALAPALAALYADSGPALLEIESDMATNRAVFADFRARAAGLALPPTQ